MNISEILYPDLVFPDLQSLNRVEIINELAENASQVVQTVDVNTITEVLLARERLGSTGLGHGVAVPHAKLENINTVFACFGRSFRGIDFAALDGKKVHLFFVFLVPNQARSQDHIKLLAKVSRIFHSAELRESLLGAEDRSEILELLSDAEKALVV